MDIFQDKSIRPMRFHQTCAPFNSNDWMYELKLSGIRCIAYLGRSETDLRNPQNVPLLPVFPELKQLHLQVKQPCILDGLLLVLGNDSADENILHQRFHTPDIHASVSPVSYAAFDLLYHRDRMITQLPLMERKTLLEDTLLESVDLTVSRTTEASGTDLFELAIRENLDGVIAKRKNSVYLPDSYTQDWVQFLTVPTDYYILCGYQFQESSVGYFLLGQYSHDLLVYKGILPASMLGPDFSLQDFMAQNLILMQQENPFHIAPVFSSRKILWFQPSAVCQLELQNSTQHSLQHAKFLRIVRNMPAKECYCDAGHRRPK